MNTQEEKESVLIRMIDLGKIFIPLSLDYNSGNGKITFRTPVFHSKEYIENSNVFYI